MQPEATCLLKGRPIRALNYERASRNGGAIERRWIFTQPQLFALRPMFLSNSETVIGNAGLDTLIQPQPDYPGFEFWRMVANPEGIWRAREYAFYRRGFEKQPYTPFGDSMTWQEHLPNGKLLVARLLFGEWKDAPVSFSVDGRQEKRSLKDAWGLGIIDIDKLELRTWRLSDGKIPGSGKPTGQETLYCEVTFNAAFNPATDLHVVDILRPNGWAHPDLHGFPLRNHPINENVEGARFSGLLDSSEFIEGCTGYHGSVTRSIYATDALNYRRTVIIGTPWQYETGVAAIDSPPKVEELQALLQKVNELGGADNLLHLAKTLDAALATVSPVIEWVQKKAPLLKQLADRLRRMENAMPDDTRPPY
ncbi:MAG: hypothetical protein PHV13_03405 [Candidatus ainarchaeum sp.]|nr:hypothetical protein [Candidatus ainarchaeum sp.]